jgi:hypothetical protein
MRLALGMFVVAAAGCADLFSIREVSLPPGLVDSGTPDGPPSDSGSDATAPVICLEDSFTNVFSTQWDTFGTVAVNSANQLSLVVPAVSTGSSYSGIFVAPRDLTGISVEFELVQYPVGPAELALEISPSSSTDNYVIAIGNSSVYWQREVNNLIVEQDAEVYQSARHRYLRMRHANTIPDQMILETRGDVDSPWSEMGRLLASLSLVSATFEFYAGSYDVNGATEGIADNVRVLGPCPLSL